ncbi:MAG: hypothetical protein H5T49_03725 [Hadesarchaea archaeon]|nr:hypothetical protein [Hadesarchaea archaeon]
MEREKRSDFWSRHGALLESIGDGSFERDFKEDPRRCLERLRAMLDELFPYRCEDCGKWLQRGEIRGYRERKRIKTLCLDCMAKRVSESNASGGLAYP